MPVFTARIIVTLRSSILDPEGAAIEHALHELAFSACTDVRVGKYVTMNVEAESEENARIIVDQACRKLLANQVMEDFTFTLEKAHHEPA
ncbi:MAG: phosphoribosylformylglycinamidine synthase subunit PurS [Chlorobi bacterium]|nr:phosphoribosylformylglycinamidine synthase subunit PurS [Chlorobiota bacterium]